jgi:hypothetical protein
MNLNVMNEHFDNACQNKHIQVLEWFKNYKYEFIYYEDAIYRASKYGYIQVLEWFKNYKYEFKYEEEAINISSENGHIKVLQIYSEIINIKKLIK